VLVLLNYTTIISSVEAADQHHQVCIPPGFNDIYNFAYNLDRLPVEESSKVQDYVLEGVRFKLTHGPADFCNKKSSYVGVGGKIIDLFSYAFCNEGIDRQGCNDCLVIVTEVTKEKCLNSLGAQASYDKCCIRYENYRFCEFS
ncbi:hypothetical protein LINPERPRIM_LOCUS19464, partial [Linum perenne]